MTNKGVNKTPSWLDHLLRPCLSAHWVSFRRCYASWMRVDSMKTGETDIKDQHGHLYSGVCGAHKDSNPPGWGLITALSSFSCFHTSINSSADHAAPSSAPLLSFSPHFHYFTPIFSLPAFFLSPLTLILSQHPHYSSPHLFSWTLVFGCWAPQILAPPHLHHHAFTSLSIHSDLSPILSHSLINR